MHKILLFNPRSAKSKPRIPNSILQIAASIHNKHEYIIVDGNDKQIGIVTSGTMSPSLKIGIGMGYVQSSYAEVGKELYIRIRNKSMKAKVVKLPFYSK